MSKAYFVITLFLFSIISPKAQVVVNPEIISIEDGLSQGFVSSITQDKEGFIWIGTKNGLNRYDGERFEVFIDDSEEQYAITGNHIITIHDDEGFMLIGTDEGLNLYHKLTKRFYNIPINDSNTGDSFIANIIKDRLGQFWIANQSDFTLVKLVLTDGFFKSLDSNFETPKGISIKTYPNLDRGVYPYYICNYNNGLLFVRLKLKEDKTWDRRFNLLDIESGNVSELNSTPLEENDEIFSYHINNNKLWLTFKGGNDLKYYEEKQWKTVKLDFPISGMSLLKESDFIFIETDDNYYFFEKKLLLKDKFSIKEASLIIPNKKTNHTNWIQDKSDNNWISTAGYGLLKIGYRDSKIKTYFNGKSIYAKPFVDNENNMHMGNPVTNERLFIESTAEGFKNIKKFIKDEETTPLCQLIQDKDNLLWGLYCERGVYKIALLDNNKVVNKKSIGKTSLVYSPLMRYDKEKHSLLIVYESKLIVYNISENNYQTYDFHHLKPSFIHRYDVAKDVKGNYWIGTNIGLVHIIPNQNGQTNYTLFNKNNGLRSNEVATLHNDVNNDHILWIGTKGGGVHKLDLNTMRFKYINSKNGLPNDVIYGILEDDHDNLWMSSNSGIISYNKTTKEIRNFNEADGLQSNEFNTYAYTKAPNGEMYFGGINGLNVFHPDIFSKNKNVPSVWITGLEINNTPVIYGDASGLLSKSIEHTSNITLPHNKNSVSIHFSGLEYSAPSNNKFSYYLDGGEEEWVHTTTDNDANYLNLSPGEYTFKIKASNSDGIWTNEIKELEIHILPPWYKTNWAYLIYIISGIGLIILIIKIRENKIKDKQQIEKSELENELLKREVAYKQKDLVDFASEISENQKWGKYLLESITKIRESKGRAKGKYLDNLVNDIRNKTFIEKNRIDFQDRIDILNNEFYQNLISQHPNLSKTDLRLCTLIKLNFSTTDISLMQNITKESVYISRKRLRKKLNLPSSVDLDVFLKQF